MKILDLITSNVDLSGLEVETAGDNDRAFILKSKLTAYLNNSRALYDYILIDCPPSLEFIDSDGFSVIKFIISTTSDRIFCS